MIPTPREWVRELTMTVAYGAILGVVAVAAVLLVWLLPAVLR